MSMKRSRIPQTNTSQDNLDYIRKGITPSDFKFAKARVKRDANEFKQFIEAERKNSEPLVQSLRQTKAAICQQLFS